MPLQKRRLGKARIRNRRSAWARRAKRKPNVQACPKCGEPRIPHRVCGKCGHYRGEAVLEIEQTEE